MLSITRYDGPLPAARKKTASYQNISPKVLHIPVNRAELWGSLVGELVLTVINGMHMCVCVFVCVCGCLLHNTDAPASLMTSWHIARMLNVWFKREWVQSVWWSQTSYWSIFAPRFLLVGWFLNLEPFWEFQQQRTGSIDTRSNLEDHNWIPPKKGSVSHLITSGHSPHTPCTSVDYFREFTQ